MLTWRYVSTSSTYFCKFNFVQICWKCSDYIFNLNLPISFIYKMSNMCNIVDMTCLFLYVISLVLQWVTEFWFKVPWWRPSSLLRCIWPGPSLWIFDRVVSRKMPRPLGMLNPSSAIGMQLLLSTTLLPMPWMMPRSTWTISLEIQWSTESVIIGITAKNGIHGSVVLLWIDEFFMIRLNLHG